MSFVDAAAIRAAFELFDTDNSGTLTVEELIAILQMRGDRTQVEELITRAEAQQMISRFDSNGDGVLDYEEFVLAFSSVQPHLPVKDEDRLLSAQKRLAELLHQEPPDEMTDDGDERNRASYIYNTQTWSEWSLSVGAAREEVKAAKRAAIIFPSQRVDGVEAAATPDVQEVMEEEAK